MLNHFSVSSDCVQVNCTNICTNPTCFLSSYLSPQPFSLARAGLALGMTFGRVHGQQLWAQPSGLFLRLIHYSCLLKDKNSPGTRHWDFLLRAEFPCCQASSPIAFLLKRKCIFHILGLLLVGEVQTSPSSTPPSLHHIFSPEQPRSS